jgi:kumamolisin
MLTRPMSAAAWIVLASLLALVPGGRAASPDARAIIGSVRTPDPGGQTMGRVRIIRPLAPGELAAPMAFSVSLRMRDLFGLQERIAAGEQVPAQQMEDSYLPPRADFDRLAAWLAAQGFTLTLPDRLHTTVFVRGSVSAISRALGVQFARVEAPDGEYTSAISEPALPAGLAPLVLSVNGLQPQFRLRHVRAAPLPQPDDLVDHFIYVTPDNVVSAYNVPAGATGAGQVIAIVGEAPLPAGDLAAFWSATGVSQSTGNITTINVDGGPQPDTDGGVTFETDLDVEWASAIAPGVQIRLYLGPDALEVFNQVSNDLPAFPNMRVLSSSYGNTESGDGSFQLRQYSQLDASMAAAGVSILCASGDAGSNPNNSTSSGSYLASAPLDVSFPASDPSVTGVAGTTVNYTGSWDYSGEVVWDEIAASMSASGGGVSSFFAKPSWQVGGPVLAGQTMRCVPDVAAI